MRKVLQKITTKVNELILSFLEMLLILGVGLGILLGAHLATATTIVTGVTHGVKFHPGHYVQPLGEDKTVNGYNMKMKVYPQMEANPAIAGLQLKLDWIDLEPSKDVVNYKLIQDHLDKLKNFGSKKKRLIIYVQTKTTSLSAPFVPSYLKTESVYKGAIYPWGNNVSGTNPKNHKGNGLKLWIPQMRDRLELLMQRLGARFNNHSHFEGIGLPETAVGKALITVTLAQEAAVHENFIHLHKKMREFFPNTMTFQFTNYPRDLLPSFIMGANNSLKSMGVALGGPDTWLNDPGVHEPGNENTPPGVYKYYPQLSGILPLTPSVQSGNYKCSRADCNNSKGNFKPTVRQLLDLARDKLKANYIHWTLQPEDNKDKEVMNMLKSLYNANSPAVKLRTACPSMYAPCITD